MAAEPPSPALVAGLLLLLGACGGEGRTNGDSVGGSSPYPPGVTRTMVDRGREVFLGKGGCHVCHGPDARGARGVGANLRDGDWWHTDGSYEALVSQIREGVPGGRARNVFEAAMPPRGGSAIDDDQLRAVAAFVWSLRLLPDSTSPLPDPG